MRFGAPLDAPGAALRGRAGSARADASGSSRASRKRLRVDGAAVERLTDVADAPARLRLPARPARARQGRAGAAPRAPRPGRRRAVARARRHAPRLLGGARAAQRARRRDPRRPRRPRLAAGLGRRARAPRDRAAWTTARPRSTSCGRASPSTRTGLGLAGEPDVALPAAVEGRDRRGARRRAGRAARVRPRARLHRPRPAPRRPRPAPRRPRAARLRLARAAAAGRCWRCCWPSARCSPRRAGRPPLMLLDDVMSELDAGRRARLVDVLRGGGQSVDHDDRPRARARRRGRRTSRGSRSPRAPCSQEAA